MLLFLILSVCDGGCTVTVGREVSRKPTRVSLKWDQDGEVIRVAKASGSIIPIPPRNRDEPAPEVGPKDTTPEKALEKTYDYDKDVEAMRLLRQTMTKYNHRLH
mmetsp:Transcript_112998/g.258819  ORF Transcript_112998/g.258819 Transcript_112998/m.258819 type:complete len:104 (+) Transcript_112998:350-661(+)